MTAQSTDLLMYKQEKLYISSEPLEDFLLAAKLSHQLVAPATSCYKGYYAKWAIDNGKLFLIGWKGYILDFVEVGMDFLFPNEDVVFAEWFTGRIRIDVGEMVSVVHGGYSSIYEGKRFLIFQKGELVDDTVEWLSKAEIESILEEDDGLDF